MGSAHISHIIVTSPSVAARRYLHSKDQRCGNIALILGYYQAFQHECRKYFSSVLSSVFPKTSCCSSSQFKHDVPLLYNKSL